MSDQPSGDLSHFENLSAKTPRQVPYAILIGAIVSVIVLVAINLLAPTEAVNDLKKVTAEKDVPTETAPTGGGQDIDDI